MKTAVEWFYDEVDRIIENHVVNMMRYPLEKAYEQAKEMEKEQIINAYKADFHPCSDEDAEQYHNETFKQ
jgi:hypothetical protein